jgi:hypothetical protein
MLGASRHATARAFDWSGPSGEEFAKNTSASVFTGRVVHDHRDR